MTRYKAFAIHLGISAVIFVGLAYLVLFVWYPDIFFTTDGGWQGMRIIIGVDLVLGPLLTLIVYKHGKPGLKFDLTCIGIFQAVCLLAGVYFVHDERPLVMVFVDGHFTSVSKGAYEDAGMEVPDLDHLPGPYPKWVMVDVPEGVIEQADFRRANFQNNRALALAADRYLPFDPDAEAVIGEPYSKEKLLERDSDGQRLPQWLSQHGGTIDDYRFYPYGSRYNYIFLGYRKDTSELVGVLHTPGPS